MTRKQLVALAKKAGIRGYSRLAKKQLAAVLASSAAIPEAAPERPTDLPASYGRTRLTLMEVDPYWIYAYWEVTSQDCSAALKRLGSKRGTAQWILRLLDVTGAGFRASPECKHFDVPIQLEAGNWYINLWASGRSYCAEIGVLTPSGRFFPVSQSNVAHLPGAPFGQAGEGLDDDPAAVAAHASEATDSPPGVAAQATAAPGAAGRQRAAGPGRPQNSPPSSWDSTTQDHFNSETLSSFGLGRPMIQRESLPSGEAWKTSKGRGSRRTSK